MYIVLFIVFISVIFKFELPVWFTFWWIILIPYIFLKLFFSNTKLFKWVNEDIRKKKKDEL